MGDGAVAVVSVDVFGDGEEHFTDQAAGVIDIRKQGGEHCNGQIPGAGKDVDVPEGTKDSGED